MLKSFVLLGSVWSVATPVTAIISQASDGYSEFELKSKSYAINDQLELVYEMERNPKKATINWDKDGKPLTWKIGEELVDGHNKFILDSNYTARYMGMFENDETEKVLIDVKHNILNLHWGFLIKNDEVLNQAKNTDSNNKDYLISKLRKDNFHEQIKSYMGLHIARKTYNARNERPIIFKTEDNDYINFRQKDKIDFLSSWGKENSDGGWAELTGFVSRDKISAIKESTDKFLYEKIHSKIPRWISQEYDGKTHYFYGNLISVPNSIHSNITSTGLAIIPEYKIMNPPVGTLKYKYEGNAFERIVDSDYKNLYLPEGSDNGLQWWWGLTSAINSTPMPNIVQSIMQYYKYDTLTSKDIKIVDEIKDRFSWIKFDEELPLFELLTKNLDIKLTYQAYASATALFGDRTEIDFSDAMLFSSFKTSRDYFAMDSMLK